MPNNDPDARRKTALQRVAAAGGREGAEAKRILASESATAAGRAQADALAALPTSIEEAKGDARAFSRADMRRQAASAAGGSAPSVGSSPGRKSMVALLKSQGMEPAR